MAREGNAVDRREAAWAKVNLALEVGPRRPDGYHEVVTFLQALDWEETVRVGLGRRPAGGVRLRVRGMPALPRGAGNLAVRAVHMWRRYDPGLGPVRVEIAKRLPAGAGLGGGSSDGAAVLRALSRLRPGRASAPGIARELGSDVPFLLSDLPAALAWGRGEHLEAAPSLPATWRVVVALGPRPLSTAAVYRRFDRLAGAREPIGERSRALAAALAALTAEGARRPQSAQALATVAPWLENDLWPAALSLLPELERVRSLLAENVGRGRPVAMTGSGSALFALVEDADRAAHAVARLLREGVRAKAAAPRGGAAEDGEGRVAM
ncbi:MAG: 4-(cytidine 5'-diphospho)-2-C-methyl-D-erythritol kinase [Firmicutes bacterium]|nr:4-(cytidine 5'-diphospho)-2-C-methyl-D-erythritol kinase [Bacillota bacterium]